MSEVLAGYKWITGTAIADTTLSASIGTRAYADGAPDVDPDDPNGDPPAYPLLTAAFIAGTDCRGVGGKRLLSKPLFLVRVIGEGGYGDIAALVMRLDALLDVQPDEDNPVSTVTIEGQEYEILGCVREHPAADSDIENGVRYSWGGGYYRPYIRAVS
ncbi:MAG: hypothetical protein A2W00_04480 [Candidatus Eisenbacteria bacterium RBG_16_71_46]|nr:MAG: hypothetical protein A2V59_06795 [Armatimonadetes bacterium RBG_19FT_COMBO_69_19]OGF05208.1 MAG: hypothetical protein A2W00_04480 [Candidatus Eisenbacteria bacterium RBG_16_71_46]